MSSAVFENACTSAVVGSTAGASLKLREALKAAVPHSGPATCSRFDGSAQSM
jgi:hypothetical protein